MMTTGTTVCAYEGGPAVTVRTGQAGNQYGLCAQCAVHTDRCDTAETILEGLRTGFRDAGHLTEGINNLIDQLMIIVPLTPGSNPLAMLTAALRHIAPQDGTAAEVPA